MTMIKPPTADGLYDPRFEHDACGVAMVARLDNVPSHDVVVRALEALDNLEHRGAEGADVNTGDGAGILIQLPDAFFRARLSTSSCPSRGRYGVGVCFLPRDDDAARASSRSCSSCNVRVEGQQRPRLARRPGRRGARRRDGQPHRGPHIRQLFIGAGPGFDDDQDAFERKLYVIRRIVELAAGPDFYSPSFSSRTCVYKGMLISRQLRGFYPDLQDERFASGAGARALALLDEHVPELGARAPVPRDRPQRRDQHADGQRQLDARPRERSSRASCSASTCRRSCRSSAPAARTRRRSTTCSSC